MHERAETDWKVHPDCGRTAVAPLAGCKSLHLPSQRRMVLTQHSYVEDL